MRPLIGVSGRRWPAQLVSSGLPRALHDAEIDIHFTEYPAAVAAAGGLPVELCRDAPVADIVERLDGLVLTGGADVDPDNYGHEPASGLGATEPERDRWELALLQEATTRGIPVLAICRGMQLLNVYRGGSLVQHLDLAEGDGHPRFDEPRSMRVHVVHTEHGSLAERLYGGELRVNSLHHQAVGDLAPGLVASGRSPDGTVEVIEVPGAAVFAVQWHPEMLEQPDPAFLWLVVEAAQYAASRVPFDE